MENEICIATQGELQKTPEKGNVLVIGNSGVGKSTLINAVLGEEIAAASWGTEGTTKELQIYEKENVPFRVIDTVGFEPSFFKERKAINAVKKWSKQSAKEGQGEKQINVIWFCVDGTSRKLFAKTIEDLSKATKMWPSVPIVTVITKSYSVGERVENIDMVNNAFAKQKSAKNLKKVIPVVASIYRLNDTAFAPPEGINELIDVTNELLPEGIRAAKTDLSKFKLSRKKALAQAVVGAATTGAVVVGAVPVPFPDAAVLTPVEIAMVNGIAKIYEISKDEKSGQFVNSIIEAGTVGVAAKTALSAIKAIPGVNIAASVLNAIVAGVFAATIGETSIYLFEQVYKGEKTVEDIDWAKKIIDSKLAAEVVDKSARALKELNGKTDKETILKVIKALFTK